MPTPLYTESRGLGPDLVLLHGWGLNSGVWEPVSHLLQAHFRITMIDLPGFGRNAGKRPPDYTLEAVSEMVAQVIPDKAILLGWSLGGLVAQQIALKQPSLLSALVLVASSPKFAQAEDWHGIRPDVLMMFEQQLERDFSKTLDRFLAIQAMGAASARQDIKIIRQHVQQFPLPDPEALQAGLGILSSADLRSQIGNLALPFFQLYGRLDSLVPAKASDAIKKLQPLGKQHVFDHASHAPFISHPQEFVEVLMQNLTDMEVVAG